MSLMDPAGLVQEPQDVTENAYQKSEVAAEKTKADLRAEVPLPSPRCVHSALTLSVPGAYSGQRDVQEPSLFPFSER